MIKIDVLLSTNTKYADIFLIKDKDNVNKLYKEYCKAFHPDVCQHVNATDAFTNLQALYNEAVKALGLVVTLYSFRQLLKDFLLTICTIMYLNLENTMLQTTL